VPTKKKTQTTKEAHPGWGGSRGGGLKAKHPEGRLRKAGTVLPPSVHDRLTAEVKAGRAKSVSELITRACEEYVARLPPLPESLS
jgi:hypothetical protein